MLVNVYENEDCIGTVEYSQNLDYWDGRNNQNGGTGRHKGLRQLKDGRLVLIHGSDWEGHHDWAEIISKEQAIQEIANSRNYELLEEFGLELPKLD